MATTGMTTFHVETSSVHVENHFNTNEKMKNTAFDMLLRDQISGGLKSVVFLFSPRLSLFLSICSPRNQEVTLK